MAIVFPTTLDTLTNPAKTDKVNSPSHADQHANANDAIEALEAKVGVDGSAVATSHDYKLSEVTSTDKAVSKTTQQTLTNKTLTSPLLTTPKIDDTDAGITITSANQTHTAPTATIPDIVDAADEFVMKDTSQVLTGKTLTTPTIGSFVNAGHNHKDAAGGGKIDEGAITLNDVTTLDVSASAHGLVPKMPNDTTKFLRGDGTWEEPAGVGEVIISVNQGVAAIAIRDVLYVEDTAEVLPGVYTVSQTQQDGNTPNAAGGQGAIAFARQSISFSTARHLKTVVISAGIFGSSGTTPTVKFELCADSAGAPGSVLVTSAAVDWSGPGNDYGERTCTLASPYLLAANTTYWLLWTQTNTSLWTPRVQFQSTDVYADGTFSYSTDGSAWTTGGDMYIKIAYLIPFGVKKADADASGLNETLIGFATAAYNAPSNTTDVPVSIQVGGVLAGFTGLTPGINYYLSTTPGAIATTGSIKVGVAISTTELLIKIA